MTKTYFICGPGRSGSTMLQATLDSHPELAVFPLEFNILFTYTNVLRSYGEVTIRFFSEYLRKNTRFKYLGSIMPMAQGQDLDLRGLDADVFWTSFNSGRLDQARSPAELLELLSDAYIKALPDRKDPKAFIIRSNNLYIRAYRTSFPGAKFLYTVRNPIDLFIGYLKYHATQTFSLQRSLEYRTLVDNILRLIQISLDLELHGFLERDSLHVRLEGLKSKNLQKLENVLDFVGVPQSSELTYMSVLGRPYGGNKVQKLPPGRGGFRELLLGKGYITPYERDRLTKMLKLLPAGPYDSSLMKSYADRICLYLPSVYFLDLCRNSINFFKRINENRGRSFRYRFPLDYIF